jgi:hypothetical protein
LHSGSWKGKEAVAGIEACRGEEGTLMTVEAFRHLKNKKEQEQWIMLVVIRVFVIVLGILHRQKEKL